jgi:hypothetical protein
VAVLKLRYWVSRSRKWSDAQAREVAQFPLACASGFDFRRLALVASISGPLDFASGGGVP